MCKFAPATVLVLALMFLSLSQGSAQAQQPPPVTVSVKVNGKFVPGTRTTNVSATVKGAAPNAIYYMGFTVTNVTSGVMTTEQTVTYRTDANGNATFTANLTTPAGNPGDAGTVQGITSVNGFSFKGTGNGFY